MFRRLLLGLLILVVVAVAAAAVFVASRQNLKFDPPTPAVTASTDSAVIARGHYIVRRIAPCADCHGDPTQLQANMNGTEVPLSGGYTFEIPPGNFRARNITPDAETGIGNFSDGLIARALRFGVGHDGRALLPFMEMQGLSDDDLAAVISYLRSEPAIRNPVPAHEYTLLGKVVRATVLANPVGPTSTPITTSPRGANVENGRYLVESVALCASCHTQRDQNTGSLVGPRFGGATNFTVEYDKTVTYSPPNITNDPATGKLARFTEDQFVARFRAGRAVPGSPMPWQGYQKLEEDDIRAIYKYLQTVPAVVNDVGPPMVKVTK